MDDSWINADPDTRRWADHVLDEVVPMIESSALTISIVPKGPSDIKFAVELGLSIMFNKPLVLVVTPGTQVPSQLVKVASEIVEVDMRDPNAKVRVAEAVARVVPTD